MPLVALLFALASDPQFEPHHAATDPAMIDVFRDLTRRSFARRDLEVAAFIVRDDDGRISCRLWPSSFVSAARYDGAMPRGTIALIHTHPVRSPMPSRGDVAEAQRVGLPIFVLTTSQLYVVSADGVSMRLPLTLKPSTSQPLQCIEERPTAMFARGR